MEHYEVLQRIVIWGIFLVCLVIITLIMGEGQK